MLKDFINNLRNREQPEPAYQEEKHNLRDEIASSIIGTMQSPTVNKRMDIEDGENIRLSIGKLPIFRQDNINEKNIQQTIELAHNKFKSETMGKAQDRFEEFEEMIRNSPYIQKKLADNPQITHTQEIEQRADSMRMAFANPSSKESFFYDEKDEKVYIKLEERGYRRGAQNDLKNETIEKVEKEMGFGPELEASEQQQNLASRAMEKLFGESKPSQEANRKDKKIQNR